MNKYLIVILIEFMCVNFYVDGWVFNNIDIEALRLHKVDPLEVNSNELAQLLSIEDNDLKLRLSLIYPGTKWCGAGDIANNFDDLGSEWQTDMCCREHDYCPDVILAGETKNNLTNEVFYTRLNCNCDEKFRKCLQEVNTMTANNIGVFYFNALSTKCFRKDYPVKKCLKKGGWLNKKCLVYSYNTTSEQVYQWFDVNNYW